MKFPFIKFFPTDWLAEPSLRACSLAARGLWMDMLSMMHLSPRRGYLLAATGSPISPVQLARMTGCTADEATQLLAELQTSGAYSCTDDGTIYSRRMVRDEGKRELCAEAGRRGGGNPTFKGHHKGRSKGDSKGGPKPLEARVQTLEEPPNPPKTGGDEVEEKPPKKPRERNLLFDAIAEATGADVSIKSVGRTIGTKAAELAAADPPYTPDEVREFRRRFHEICSYARKEGRERPTVGEVAKNICHVRSKRIPDDPVLDAAARNAILNPPNAAPMTFKRTEVAAS